MRKSALSLAALPLLAGGLLVTASTAFAAEKLTGEQQLAKKLEGRVAGKPVSCIPLHDTETMEVIDKTAIVFGWGNTLYVNRPRNAADLDSDNVLVHKSSVGEWCNVDIVTAHTRPEMWFHGTVSLGEFVPYTKVKPPAVKASR